MDYDIIIIGAGTAGLSAAIYGVRAGLSVLVIENHMHGGQIVNTPDIVNYPAIEMISGYEFATNLVNHATHLGAEIIYDQITSMNLIGTVKKIQVGQTTYYTKAVIIATGARHRHLGCEGEEEFQGRGVAYCATCDGNFYKDQDVCVVGGGNTALEDAIYLSKICRTVHLVHRRKEFTGHRTTADKVRSTPNIVLHMNRQVTKISGNDTVEQVLLEGEGRKEPLAVQGVFVAIGLQPDNKMFEPWVKLDSYGYIVAGEDCKTSQHGVFVAGDTRTKTVRQLITAAADGAVAATGCAQMLNNK